MTLWSVIENNPLPIRGPARRAGFTFVSHKSQLQRVAAIYIAPPYLTTSRAGGFECDLTSVGRELHPGIFTPSSHDPILRDSASTCAGQLCAPDRRRPAPTSGGVHVYQAFAVPR